MKSLILISVLLMSAVQVFASECKLQVENSKTGENVTVELTLLPTSNKSTTMLVGETPNFSAAYEYSTEKGKGTETLIIADVDANIAQSVYRRDSNPDMELKLQSKSGTAVLKCKNDRAR